MGPVSVSLFSMAIFMGKTMENHGENNEKTPWNWGCSIPTP